MRQDVERVLKAPPGGRNNQPLAEMSSGLRLFWSINTARPNKRVGES